MPGVERHAAVSGTEVRRTAGRARPGTRPALTGMVRGLLLWLRHLHPGLPPGREDRRAQRACSPRREGASRATAPGPADRAPDRARPPRDARGADRERDAAGPAGPHHRRAADRRAPRCAAAELRGEALSLLGPPAPE